MRIASQNRFNRSPPEYTFHQLIFPSLQDFTLVLAFCPKDGNVSMALRKVYGQCPRYQKVASRTEGGSPEVLLQYGPVGVSSRPLHGLLSCVVLAELNCHPVDSDPTTLVQ